MIGTGRLAGMCCRPDNCQADERSGNRRCRWVLQSGEGEKGKTRGIWWSERTIGSGLSGWECGRRAVQKSAATLLNRQEKLIMFLLNIPLS